MKAKIALYLQKFRTGFAGMLRLHPVEAALIAYACIGCLLTYELDWEHALPKLSLAPLFFVLALALNNLTGQGPWRRAYWVVWTPMVPLSLWSGLEAWVATEPAFITFGVLVPLALLLCRRAVRNDRFICDVLVWVRSGLLAALFANVALGLFGAILFSANYIFGLNDGWVDHLWTCVLIVTETLAFPVLFLMLSDRWAGGEYRGPRVVEVLLNYIVTPALLIYAVILYLYMVKILVTASLPEGGVAYLVFGFTLFALAVQAVQFLLQKRLYDWFFDRFSLISLPTQVLFWVGVLRRTNEYGLTEPRVYLLLCGGLMTLCVLLFLRPRTGRYYYVCLTGLLAFAALVYLPSLEPQRMAVRSQTKRVVRLARSLGRLDEAGKIRSTPVPLADTARWEQYHELYESLRFLARSGGDSLHLSQLGLERAADFLAPFPEPFARMVQTGSRSGIGADGRIRIELPENFHVRTDGEYPDLYLNLQSWGQTPGYSYENDTLRLYLGRTEPCLMISGGSLLQRQCAQSGYDPASGAAPTAEQRVALLDYRDARYRILFRDFGLVRTEAGSEYRLENVTVYLVLSR